MTSQKRIWEIQHQTICKVIGMALDFGDLKKIADKFGLPPQDPLMDHEFALHSTVAHLCGTNNRVSRYVQKTIESRFAKYSKRLSGMDPLELIALVTEGPGNLRIPLWAVLWDLSTRGLENGASIETAVFGFIHMLEHRLLKEYWETAAENEEQSEEVRRNEAETLGLKRRILDLRSEIEKSRKLSQDLRSNFAEMKRLHRRPNVGHMRCQPSESAPRSDSSEKIKRLRYLLEDSRAQNRGREDECCRLRREIEVLVQEVSMRFTEEPAPHETTPKRACPLQDALRGKHVAMVGGIDSLESHYRRLVQEMGGAFHRHDGDCKNGACLIEDCIKKADLVVCPVEVNSHNAAKSAKKICKRRGIPCCFTRTAGLSGLRIAIEEHYADSDVA